VDSQRLVAYRLAARQIMVAADILGSSIDDLLAKAAALDAFLLKAMDAQVARNGGGGANYFWIAVRPQNNSTNTYNHEILEGDVELPANFYGPLMAAFQAENIVLTLTVAPYTSASILTILNAVAAVNGAADFVDIGASGGTAVTGDFPAPLRVKVKGGDTNTNRLLLALRTRGTPSNFKQTYWAKDATLTANTVSTVFNYGVTNAVLTANVATLTIAVGHHHVVGDTVVASSVSLNAAFNGTWVLTAVNAGAGTISYALVHANIGTAASTGTVSGEVDGNGTGNGTRTTAANTNENLTHAWTNTTNVSDQFAHAHIWGRFRSNTAGRYSARVRQGLTDGTNTVYPADGGYLTASAQAIGTDSGNNWAWVDLGEYDNSQLAAVYGIVFQLYTTCSNISGPPTLDFDGLFLFPVGEGPVNTGIVEATYDLGSAASGVDNAVISGVPGDPPAYLANSGDVVTFPTQPDAGSPLYALPATAARLYLALIDNTNGRHDATKALTVTVSHELRSASVIGA
jgi:hypothetical protein